MYILDKYFKFDYFGESRKTDTQNLVEMKDFGERRGMQIPYIVPAPAIPNLGLQNLYYVKTGISEVMTIAKFEGWI